MNDTLMPDKLYKFALNRIEAWRTINLQIGFTNGCFDLLHPGHISLLSKAKSECDKLIVGLNSDVSVGRLKGSQRPVQTEEARATILNSLKAVDCVIIFNEDTPLKLIERIKPDVLIKGGDYKLSQVVGADFIKVNGGRVVLANYQVGHSTSKLINKIENL